MKSRFFITEAPEKTTEAHFSHEHMKQMKSLEQEMKILVMVNRNNVRAGEGYEVSWRQDDSLKHLLMLAGISDQNNKKEVEIMT